MRPFKTEASEKWGISDDRRIQFFVLEGKGAGGAYQEGRGWKKYKGCKTRRYGRYKSKESLLAQIDQIKRLSWTAEDLL